jgi:hypothetical protein
MSIHHGGRLIVDVNDITGPWESTYNTCVDPTVLFACTERNIYIFQAKERGKLTAAGDDDENDNDNEA